MKATRPAPRARAAPAGSPGRAAAAQRRSPAGAKAEQRVRDIVRVGRDVLSERGFERATITEIAQRLGASEATVFTYFHGKRELCVRVISDWYDEITAEIAEGLPKRKSVRAQLEYFVQQKRTRSAARGTCGVKEAQERVERAARIDGGPVHGMPWKWGRGDDRMEKALRRGGAPLHVDILRRSAADAVAQPLQQRCAAGSASSRNDWNA